MLPSLASTQYVRAYAISKHKTPWPNHEVLKTANKCACADPTPPAAAPLIISCSLFLFLVAVRHSPKKRK